MDKPITNSSQQSSNNPVPVLDRDGHPHLTEEVAETKGWMMAYSGSHRRFGAKEGGEPGLTNPTYHLRHILSDLMTAQDSELASEGQRSAICPQRICGVPQEGATGVTGRPCTSWPRRGPCVPTATTAALLEVSQTHARLHIGLHHHWGPSSGGKAF